MFKAHFSFSSTVFTKDIKTFFYFTSTSDEKTIINREIIKIVYKVESDKALKMNEITNRILQQFNDVAIKQLRFLFDRCIQKNI